MRLTARAVARRHDAFPGVKTQPTLALDSNGSETFSLNVVPVPSQPTSPRLKITVTLKPRVPVTLVAV